MKFRLVARSEMGLGRKAGKKPGFAKAAINSIEAFYGDILQNLSGYQPKAPKIQQRLQPVEVESEPLPTVELIEPEVPEATVAEALQRWSVDWCRQLALERLRGELVAYESWFGICVRFAAYDHGGHGFVAVVDGPDERRSLLVVPYVHPRRLRAVLAEHCLHTHAEGATGAVVDNYVAIRSEGCSSTDRLALEQWRRCHRYAQQNQRHDQPAKPAAAVQEEQRHSRQREHHCIGPLSSHGSIGHRPRLPRCSLTPVLADLCGDGGDDLVEVADDGPVGFGDHVGFGVGVDGQDVLGTHGANPMLGGSRDTAGDVDRWRDSGAGLADLIGVRTPTVIGHRTTATDLAPELFGEFIDGRKRFF